MQPAQTAKMECLDGRFLFFFGIILRFVTSIFIFTKLFLFYFDYLDHWINGLS